MTSLLDHTNLVFYTFQNFTECVKEALNNLVISLVPSRINIWGLLNISGFAEARRACCGTGLLETSILCNPKSVGTCSNATQYVFWDGFHPTEAANKILSDNLLVSGISLIS